MPAPESGGRCHKGRVRTDWPSVAPFGGSELSSRPRACGAEGTACLLLAGFRLLPTVTLPAW